MPVRRVLKSELFIKITFFVSLFFIVVIAGIGYRHISNLSKSSNLMMHTYSVNIELEQILSYLKDAETGQRGFITTKDSIYLRPFISGRDNINNSFAQLRVFTQNDSIQYNNLISLKKIIDKRFINFELENQIAFDYGTNSQIFKKVFLEGKNIMDEIRNQLQMMISLENKKLRIEENKNREFLKNTPLVLYGLVFITLLVIYFSYSRIIKNLEGVRLKNKELEIFKKATIQSEKVNNVGSWRWNIDSNKFQFSENLFRLLGEKPYSFEQTVEAFNQFVHPDDVEKLNEHVEAMMEMKELPFIYFRIIQKDGTVRHLKSFGKSIINIDGSKQLLGTTTDITDEIANMHLLEKRNKELLTNNKELQAFNYVASHDLQEPLRKIQTFLSRLEEKESNNLSASGKKYIERITNAAKRMRQLIDDLLQYSRTNKSDEVLENTDLNKLLDITKENLAELIASNEAVIVSDKLPTAEVIPFQIQQLFSNLISNSIKYKSTQRQPRITITYEFIEALNEYEDTLDDSNNFHEIIFSDNGIGFEPEYAEQIFVLFNRLHNRDDYSGTGIGLSICKKIMDNHNGKIYAEGFPDEGARFTIHLPA
ncbi:CHASE3 domain-containing protein [Winogradskyella litorisediminis]|uniref:histidine kinase n=1 Tax=Winogradskyella litorisediminis TaxID=1156618 RepID=A0ABW3N398_9FLAO